MQTKTSKVPQGQIEEIYNALMWQIEPELTTLVLPDLDVLYKSETPEERHARYEWYAIAFEQFLLKFKEFIGQYETHVHDLKKQLLHAGERGF